MKKFKIAVCALTMFAMTSWGALEVRTALSEEIKSREPLPPITMEQALKTAKEHVPGRVIEAEYEEDEGKSLYEIEVVSNDGIVRELQVDANTGEIIRQAGKGEVSYIPLENAIRVAMEYLRWHVVEVELEENGQQAVYEIELVSYNGDTVNLQVDAISGEVVEAESQSQETD